MKRTLILLGASAMAMVAMPALAHDTLGTAHTHEHQVFFYIDDAADPHYEHVYSSIPPLDPADYYLEFDALDKNGNGYLTRSEVRRADNGASEETRANLLREFNATDPNHDGRLYKAELGDWLVMDTE